MTTPATLTIEEMDLNALRDAEGALAVVVDTEGKLSPGARKLDKLLRGAVTRLVASEAFSGAEEGSALGMSWPGGVAAQAAMVLKLGRRAPVKALRRAGAALAKAAAGKDMLLVAGAQAGAQDLALGALLRAYDYIDMKSPATTPPAADARLRVMVTKPETVDAGAIVARAQGVFFTRDLVNAPANVLTTTRFAKHLMELKELGVEVSVVEEDALEARGLNALLAVGRGSETPSKLVILEWKGAEGAPLALVGKGVVFDTGGVSLKPAGGMEEMTMDMGGAGTVAGVMKVLALRKAKAHVVGVVGLVENMPDGRAMRPGDVVTSMKGDTIEVINTDAEGRLVLCDAMWLTQEDFAPAAMIDLATLTGAAIVALGHENAAALGNDDALTGATLKAAGAEGEGLWHLPLDAAYGKGLKSRVADLRNVGAGRAGGTIVAAKFLEHFVKPETPWLHLDIAGVASLSEEGPTSPKGATGWGVLTLDRLIADRFEG